MEHPDLGYLKRALLTRLVHMKRVEQARIPVREGPIEVVVNGDTYLVTVALKGEAPEIAALPAMTPDQFSALESWVCAEARVATARAKPFEREGLLQDAANLAALQARAALTGVRSDILDRMDLGDAR